MLMRIGILILSFMVVSLFGMDNSRALKLKIEKMKKEQRVALVIGNDKYYSKNLPNLKNPINDARLMKKILEERNFEVYYLINATKREFAKAIKRFGNKLKRGGVGLFYFAGHGLQVDGYNYLVASDSNIEDKSDVEFEAIALNRITKKMQNARNRLNIVILDACRNDPFSRGMEGGLAPVSNAKGIFVAYATEAGKVASDGDGKNGVFTKYLAKNIVKPLSIEEVFKKTREDVSKKTNGEQFPGVYNQIIGDFYFTLPKIRDEVTKTNHIQVNSNIQPDEEAWKYMNKNSIQDLKSFIKHFPDSKFIFVAKLKLSKLKSLKNKTNLLKITKNNFSLILDEDYKVINKPIRAFKGHKSVVTSIAFSPNGKYIISGSSDKTLKLWDVNTGECIRTFRGHIDAVNSVTFSSDGRYVLSGSWDSAIKLWDVNTGECIRTFRGHTGWVNSVTFSSDGRYIVSGSSDKTLKLWDVNTGECIRTFRGHTGSIRSVNFSPNGKYIISGSSDKTLKLWDVTTSECIRTFRGHNSWINSVNFSSDGRYIVSGSSDKTLKLWDVNTGKCIRTFLGHSSIWSVVFSPNGRYIVSGSSDNTIKLWDVNTGKLIRTFEGHNGFIFSVTFSSDGKYIISGSQDKTIKLYEL
jgi:WD40 repeat protein